MGFPSKNAASEVKLLSHVQRLATPWAVAYLAPLSMGFSRQEHWSGLPCPPPGDLLDPGIETTSLMSPALAPGFFTTEPPGKPQGTLASSDLNRTGIEDRKMASHPQGL